MFKKLSWSFRESSGYLISNSRQRFYYRFLNHRRNSFVSLLIVGDPVNWDWLTVSETRVRRVSPKRSKNWKCESNLRGSGDHHHNSWWQKWWSPPPVIDCPPYKNSGSQKSPFCHTSDRYTTNVHHLHRHRVPWSPNALSFFLPSFVCFLFNKTAAGQGNVPVSKMARTFNHNCRCRRCDQSNWQELLNRFCRRLFVCVYIHTLTNRQMTTTILSRPLHTSSLSLSYWVFLFSVSVCPATAAAAIITHFGPASLISFSFRCLPKTPPPSPIFEGSIFESGGSTFFTFTFIHWSHILQ